MGVEDSSVIDFTGLRDGVVHLTIADALDWSDADNHLCLLQKKLNSYLTFIESGQILKDYPLAIDKRIVISIYMKYEPVDSVADFFHYSQKVIENAGVGFECVIGLPR